MAPLHGGLTSRPPRGAHRASDPRRRSGPRGGGGGCHVDTALDALGWKHVFFLLAAYVLLRPFLARHAPSSHGSSGARAASVGRGGAETLPSSVVDAHLGSQPGDVAGRSSRTPPRLHASVDDAEVAFDAGPDPHHGRHHGQVGIGAGSADRRAGSSLVSNRLDMDGGDTVEHVPSRCCDAGLPQWASWVETQERCRWRCGGGHLVGGVGVGLLNRKQRAGGLTRAPEPWECAWSCVSTVDERTMRCAACPYEVTGNRVSNDVLVGHDANAASCAMQPCSRNCEGGFARWSPCSKPCGGGTQYRAFEVTVREEFGGAPCDFEDGHKEWRDCNPQACAVDCQGYWDEWGTCSRACGGGQQTRRYVVEHPASHGGLPCGWSHGSPKTRTCNSQPCPVDCVGNWTAWTACDERCGGGRRRRRFNIFVESENGGRPCEYGHGDVTTETCNTQPCPVDCIGSFSPWGECSSHCDGGNRSRTYYVLSPAQHGGAACERKHEEVETEPCNQGKACEVDCAGEWSRWSKCIASDVDPLGRLCGPGLKSRKYTVTRHARFGGKPCEAKHGQTHRAACTERACPRDCAGRWDTWQPCDASCGGGMQKRVFRVTAAADDGGAPCEAEALETQFRKCNVQACDENCVGEWGAWGRCGASGTRSRTFTVLKPARGKGAACEAADGDTADESC